VSPEREEEVMSRLALGALCALVVGCTSPQVQNSAEGPDGAVVNVTRQNHPFFPVVEGNHNVDCNSCHTAPTFKQFNCINTGCHPCEATAPRHPGLATFVCDPPKCFECHPKGVFP
jgi:hypothetical protein